MGERSQESVSSDSLEELYEPALTDLVEEEFEELLPPTTAKQNLTEKRRRAELRLEEKRLRDELGDYDLELDDF